MNIYIGNLAPGVTVDALKRLFVAYGDVDSCKIINDHRSGISKGFGFVEMPSNSEADQAIKNLNGKFIDGQHIKVNHADPGGKKKRRRSRRRRY